jgi:2-dehydropantoate 2-reductase
VVIKLGGEAVRVGRALGYQLEKITGIEPTLLQSAAEGDKAALDKVEAHIATQTTGTGRSNLQRPSMAQDMQKGRRTEIGEINGFIVQKAKEAGCEAPTHERIVDVVRKVERGELSPKPELLFFND